MLDIYHCWGTEIEVSVGTWRIHKISAEFWWGNLMTNSHSENKGGGGGVVL